MTYRNDLEHCEATEAKEIMRLLKKMGRPQAKCAPLSFQAKVLARLEEKHANRRRFTWAFWYLVPLALAVGLVIGITLAPFFLSQEIERSSLVGSVDFRGLSGVLSSSDKHQSPEEWLESIAELLMTGQVSNAFQQLGAFRQQYPGYEQNSSTQ